MIEASTWEALVLSVLTIFPHPGLRGECVSLAKLPHQGFDWFFLRSQQGPDDLPPACLPHGLPHPLPGPSGIDWAGDMFLLRIVSTVSLGNVRWNENHCILTETLALLSTYMSSELVPDSADGKEEYK